MDPGETAGPGVKLTGAGVGVGAGAYPGTLLACAGGGAKPGSDPEETSVRAECKADPTVDETGMNPEDAAGMLYRGA